MELRSLLHTAKQHGEEASPRLIIADWLEERGDPGDRERAEFIRLQIELCHAESPGSTKPNRQRKQQRCDELLRAHRQDWLGPFSKLGNKGNIKFERGLLHLELPLASMTGRAGQTLLEGEAVWWIDRLLVRISGINPLNLAMESPLLPHVGTLVLPSASLGVDAVRLLGEKEALVNLSGLDLNYNHVGNAGVGVLGQCPHLSNLRSLDLWINRIGATGIASMAKSPHLRHLTHLNLGGNSLRGSGTEALCKSPITAPLRTLLLWGNNIGQTGARALSRSRMPHLESLYLNENRLDHRCMEHLASWPQLRKLKTLSLWRNKLESTGVKILASQPLPHLSTLLINENRLDDDALRSIASQPGFAGLRKLDLHGNPMITESGMRSLIESPYLSREMELIASESDFCPSVFDLLSSRFALRTI